MFPGYRSLRRSRAPTTTSRSAPRSPRPRLQRFDGLDAHLPLVARALPFVGHYQTRARGTVCGSIAHADPSSELPLCLATLDGEVVLRSARRTRAMAAADFQRDVLTTACEPEEMIVAVRFPIHAPAEGCAFSEFGIRHGDFAIVAVAVIAGTTGVRVGIGGCSDRPHVTELPPLDGDALADKLNALAWSLPFDDDHHARRTVSPRSRAHPGTADGGGGDAMPRLSANTRHRVTVTLNGRHAEGDAEPRLLLSDFLRHQLGATGVHVGCEHGICGACTVRVDGELSRACLMFAVQADGSAIETVEGLSDGESLSELQAAFRRHHALQCGYCTPGILMSFTDLLEREPAPDEARVREVLGGHLCRCTGYAPIVDAVLDVARRSATARDD